MHGDMFGSPWRQRELKKKSKQMGIKDAQTLLSFRRRKLFLFFKIWEQKTSTCFDEYWNWYKLCIWTKCPHLDCPWLSLLSPWIQRQNIFNIKLCLEQIKNEWHKWEDQWKQEVPARLSHDVSISNNLTGAVCTITAWQGPGFRSRS